MSGRARVAHLIAGPAKASSGDFAFAREEVELVRAAGARRGLDIVAQDWDAAGAGAGADLILVGPCWDYQDRAEIFLARLDAMEAQAPVLNPPRLIRWNARKTYLQDLERAGAPCVPTLWREGGGAADLAGAFAELSAEMIVVKPQVGAGAVGLFRIGREDVPAYRGHPTLRAPHMIQPYLHAITAEGEHSYVFFDGRFAHALLKTPKTGDFRSQGEYGARETRIMIPPDEDLAAAERALGGAPADGPPLYARVDMVRGAQGALLVMELELIEPQLYFNVAPESAERFVDAVARRLD